MTLAELEEVCVMCSDCSLMDYASEITDDMYLKCDLRADYIQSIYFTVITMTTVGYGEINPESDYAKMFDCLIMMATLIIIPQQTGELLELIRKQSKYRTKRYSRSNEEIHLILAGDITL